MIHPGKREKSCLFALCLFRGIPVVTILSNLTMNNCLTERQREDRNGLSQSVLINLYATSDIEKKTDGGVRNEVAMRER